jgi:ATP-dependent exoDNAse (exonuclease V) alpha subunit
MVGTRKLAALLTAAHAHNTRVVLVGDPRQLPEVDAGGAFARIADRAGTVELTENRRQTEPWERDALAEVRHGDMAAAVTVYRDKQRITLTDNAEAARDTLVTDWWTATRAGQQTLMVALTQVDVDDLNRRARTRLAAEGLLGGDTLIAAGKTFSVGDQVLFLRNDRRIGVTNGQRATVTTLGEDSGMAVQSDTSKPEPLRVPWSYLEAGHVTHGYATTIHKAQGVTVDQAFVLGSERLYREAGYTALSRARIHTGLYHVNPTPARGEPGLNPYRQLAGQLERSQQQHLATPLPPGAGLAERSEIQTPPQLAAALGAAALADPPDYLIARIGPPPLTGTARTAWDTAAVAVEIYRERHGITSLEALGPEPDDPHSSQARLHRLAEAALQQAEHALARTPDRDLGLGL